jgi:hypothetical protein
MASHKLDPEILAHLEWIGFVRPTGLVVSPPALVRAGAILDRRDAEGQRLLRACVEERAFDPTEGPVPHLPDFRAFTQSVLGWSFSPKGYAGTQESPIPNELEVPLSDYGETLRPDFAVRELEPQNGASPWQLLVRVLEPGEDLDRVFRGNGRLEASPHGRMERLLRQTGVPAGLLFNGRVLRLLSAPRGESSGWMDFRVADMVQTAGRPISTALRLLLSQQRLLSLPRHQRLAALLDYSRKYQNEVSERLAEQVLHALYELLGGFQAAHDASKGELLRQPLAEHPDEVYRGLLTVILRLIFLLYAEERDMLPEDETFLRYYSLAGLHERLREDAALYPDTMDQRYGAWAQLLVLFRMIHDGAENGAMRLPRRHGVLFDPDRFPFLEGRMAVGARQIHERIEASLVPDGTIYRALEKLLVLDGERISYRALDVEQIGSVYETMMGFRLETAVGRSVAIKAQKKGGAPTAVDLEALLAEPASKRAKWIQDRADRKFPDTVTKAMTVAERIEDLHAGLISVIDLAATPDLVPQGAMVLQPSEERRRSGSHYTPRSLTEPIVRTTLEPILVHLRGQDGGPPKPHQILELKVCDPAMGSGAFLVEACRQLGDALVEAWHAHEEVPVIPPDEDEVVFARRLIAKRCLYGVDRNPVAVDLAKVSLWLVTLAKDHALTFVDHALRHGDSLVGLSRKQIEAFHWDVSKPPILRGLGIRDSLDTVTDLRRKIREADESIYDRQLRQLWDQTQFELGNVRLFGDLALAAFFEGEKPKDRESKLNEYVSEVASGKAERWRGWLEERRHADPPLAPFHWDIEFPEVFGRDNPGFDVIVGNPPFLGGKKISQAFGDSYRDWLDFLHVGASGHADLVAHFFRRVFTYIRRGGVQGLIATNTISQGDTREAGLLPIVRSGGLIFSATRRLAWPGSAEVIVSVVFISKGSLSISRTLDNKKVNYISAYLFEKGGDEPPAKLFANKHMAFIGFYVHGPGFLFDDSDSSGLSSPILLMEQLIRTNPRNAERIFPYIGGADINTGPKIEISRYVIDFGEMPLDEAKKWPELLEILARNVRPYRMQAKTKRIRDRWWLFEYWGVELHERLTMIKRALVISRIGNAFAFTWVPSSWVLNEKVVIFPFEEDGLFCLLQSQVHEHWARFFSTTLKDDLQYTPTKCFVGFPFPPNWRNDPNLEETGRAYYQFRSDLMKRQNQGLTTTYNCFHNPDDTVMDIVRLRTMHIAMDRAALDAYGWIDISTDCGFFLDYEINEEEWGNKRKPWRYRWPDDVRDEVLARLLEVNAQRARDEAQTGIYSTIKRGRKAAKKYVSETTETGDLFT